MKLKSKCLLLISLLSWAHINYAQSELQIVNIGDFKTTNGDVINDCKIGYRTVGQLNADKSNAVLWPTWFSGTSGDIINNGIGLIDTTDLFVVVVDALSNGVSSSPSNTPEFPIITIRDMVNTQYELLVKHLEIDQLFAVMGVSMGGMQTFEWTVAYPEMISKAITIVGTPKQSSYDKLVWQTMADLMTAAGQDQQKLDFAYRQAHNILLMNAWTPTFFANAYHPDSLQIMLDKEYTNLKKPADYLGGLNAMIPHDIYQSADSNIKEINNVIKADLLIIAATQDHLVNPLSSIELAKTLDAQLVTLDGDCGHIAFACETEKIKTAITKFLNDR